jgi:hypothetical protein
LGRIQLLDKRVHSRMFRTAGHDRQTVPISPRNADIFLVALSDPQLDLDAPANRTAITTRVSIASSLMKAGRVDGKIAISSALRYDTAARALKP